MNSDAITSPLVGSRAPQFALPQTGHANDGPSLATLDGFRDRWLVLFFYPRDFSLVCPTELSSLSRRIAEFAQRDCDILGVSTDSLETHERWIATPSNQGGLGGLNFHLATDESGAVCRVYGVHLARQNVALRGLFVIDPNSVIQYQVVHNLSVGRSVDELLRVLDALQSGGMCPEAWATGQAPIDPSRELGPNQVVGGYRIETEIGRGGFGVVFRAWDTVLSRPVALKVLRTDAQRPAEDLLNEARSAAALNHPNICTIHTVDSSSGIPVIVMELVEGQSLNEWLAQGPVPRETALRLAAQIAGGLDAAHLAGIVHGDLKPANILVRTDGVVKLMDFGLSRRIPLRADRTSDAVPSIEAFADTIMHHEPVLRGITGTPYYMSPEQARGQPISTASDIFSFGLILFELLTSRRAITAATLLEALYAVNDLNVETLLSEVDPRDANVLRALLAREPSLRPTSAILTTLLLG